MDTTLKSLRTALVGAALLGMTACASTLNSSIDTAEAERLDDFKTYAWLGNGFALGNTRSPEVANPINDGRIRTAINHQLADKGYRLVDRTQADFVISAALGANDELRVREYYSSLGYGYYGGFTPRGFGRGFGNLSQSVSIDSYTKGVLVLDVFENRTKEAVWHGSASKRLSKKFMAPELINEAAAALLEQFPDRQAKQSERQQERLSSDAMS